jgi:hypothetical protein
MCRSTRSASLLTLVAIGLFSHRVCAEQGGPLNDRFAVTVGIFAFESNTRLRADELDSMELGTTIDLEQELGFDDDTLLRATAVWRPRPRHKVWAMIFDADRSATKAIDRDIEFGEEKFPLGADVESVFRTKIVELAYEYVLVRREAFEIGASLGIHDVDFILGLSADVLVPGQQVEAQVVEEVSADVPLPVFGLRGTWHLGGDVFASAHAQYFELEIEEYSGYLQDFQVSLLWQFSRHAGVGVGYNLFRSSADMDDDGFRGGMRRDYGGVQFFLSASF